MILEADSTEVVSNIDSSKTKRMGVSEAGLAHVMNALTILYNDPETAVIREYTANGIDSHIAAGQTRPVEVTLPDRYTNQFIVEDWGVGMSAEEIDSIYRMYGESTKRDTNTQIGAFGFGAKSALAITSQFTVRSIKDGRLTTVLIQKGSDGYNTVTTVAERETDEPNGVKVSIPVDAGKIDAFNSKARRFFRFAEPSLILVDGVAPKSIYLDATRISDPDDPDFVGYLNDDSGSRTSYVVMGGVSYALSDNEQRESLDRLDLSASWQFFNLPKIFPVPIGTVDLTPNREGLRFTDKTNDAVDVLMRSFYNGLSVSAQAEIDAVEDRFEAYSVIKKWNERLSNEMAFTWNGEEVKRMLRLEHAIARIARHGWNSKNDHSTTFQLYLDTTVKKIFVVGRGPEKYKRITAYLADYLRMRDLRAREVMFYFAEDLTEDLDSPWLLENSSFEFTDYDTMIAEVKAYRKENAPPKAPKEPKDREKITYPVLYTETNIMEKVDAKDIPNDAYVVVEADFSESSAFRRFFSGTSGYPAMLRESRLNALKLLADVHPEIKALVFLPKSRKLEVMEKKAKRTFPSLSALATPMVEEIKTLMTEDVQYYRWVELNGPSSLLYQLAAHPDMADPDIAGVLPDPSVAEKATRLKALFNLKDTLLVLDAPYVDDDVWRTRGKSLRTFTEKYPVLGHVGDHRHNEKTLDHLVVYVNSIHSTVVNSDES